MKKRVPYSIASYEEITGGEYYYVDKTAYIRELENYTNQLVTASRDAGYFNELEGLNKQREQRDAHIAAFETFLDRKDWGALFQAYWEIYFRQIPAQAFDKMNENFFRTTFYELCTRYLNLDYTLAAESNLRSERCDFVALPRPESPFTDATAIEFKYYKADEAKKLGVLDWTKPPENALAQAKGYAADLRATYPQYVVTPHVLCIAGTADFQFFYVSQEKRIADFCRFCPRTEALQSFKQTQNVFLATLLRRGAEGPAPPGRDPVRIRCGTSWQDGAFAMTVLVGGGSGTSGTSETGATSVARGSRGPRGFRGSSDLEFLAGLGNLAGRSAQSGAWRR